LGLESKSPVLALGLKSMVQWHFMFQTANINPFH
jgi:hypothetical protein